MKPLLFDNRFIADLPADPVSGPGLREVREALYSRVAPTPVADPRLLAWSPETAALLDLDQADITAPGFAQVFGGNALLQGMQPFAANYGGHQFGHWAGQLGDGRAISLGELINAAGQRWELQLKGAGPTPYSRHADGRAVLRSSIREFLCSEAMHHLGVPTTRALSLVATGESVVRDMFYDGHPKPEAGAIVCRVAPSFLRFGNFELPASRGELPLLRQLVDFTIRRDFPELQGEGEALYAQWFASVCERTAVMVAHWTRVGFVHGVMNTDNMSILGLTIDYGPYGWIDNYDPDWTPNTTDAQGRRYRFGWQAKIAYWNLTRLAGALSGLFAQAEALQAGLQMFRETYAAVDQANVAGKLGLAEFGEGDASLMEDLLALLHAGEIDMTIFFRRLSRVDAASGSCDFFADAYYSEAGRMAVKPALSDWLQRYRLRIAADGLDGQTRAARMQAVNPKYVLRNYLVQQVIEQAEQDDYSGISNLLEVMRRPYEDQPSHEEYANRRPEWARDRAGCSQLSCSS